MPRNACVECGGNGKCRECAGTGTNVHLNDAEPKCRNCSGTGTCAKCNGTGRAFVIQPEIQDLGLDKL
jgi:hypothetical protein